VNNLTASVPAGDALFKVPARAGTQIRCSLDLSYLDLKRFANAATKGRREPDCMRFDTLIVGHLTNSIVVDGHELPGFSAKETQDRLKVGSAAQAVRKVFGCPARDADLNRVADELVFRCGWTKDDDGNFVSRLVHSVKIDLVDQAVRRRFVTHAGA
jgi:hypothetical protein